MTRSATHPFSGYVYSILYVFIAVGIRHLLHPILEDDYVFAPILLAILVAAYFFGYRPALAALVVGAIAALYALMEPIGSLRPLNLEQQIGLVLYVAIGLGIIRIAGTMHDAQAALREANLDLEKRVRERTEELALRNEQLQISRERLSFALTCSRTGGWELDLSDLRIHRTSEYDRIFGYESPPQTWSYDVFLNHVVPEDRAAVDHGFQTALAGGKTWDFECRIERVDSGQRWIWARGELELDGAGNPTRMAGVVKDITDRKLDELVLKERERLLAVVTGTARVGMVIVGPGYRYLFANEAYSDIFGLPNMELKGRRVPEILPEAWSQIQPRLDRALAGEHVAYELSLPRPKGQPHGYYAVTYEPRLDENGERSVIVVVVDVTERKHAELTLLERERMLQFVTSSVCVGLVVIDSDYRYLFANEAYGRIYGFEASTIVGRTVPEVIPLAWPQIKPHLDQSLGGKPGSFDLVLPPLPGKDHTRTLAVVYEPRARSDGSMTSVVVISDISERKLATETAARLSERVTLATKAAGIGIWDWDLLENRISWDDQMFNLYGRARGDFAGAYEAWLAGIHPEDRERCDRESEEARNKSRHYESEFRVLWPNGSVHHLKALGEVFCDDAGTPIRMLGVNFDITHARLYAAALQQSQARLEAALSSMTDAVFISDLSQELVHYNDAFVTFHRFRDRAECDRRLEDYYELFEARLDDGSIVPPERWAIPRALAGDRVTNAECILRRLDSEEEWYASYSFSPIRDSEGTIVGAVVVARDVTELRLAERAIKEQESRFRQIAENIREVFWMVDLEHGTVLYASPAYETIWGRPLDVVYSSPSAWKDAVHPEDREKLEKAIAGQMTGQIGEVEYRIIRPSGEIRWIRDLSFPITDEAGTPYRVAGVAEDITERRQAESESQMQRIRLEGIVNSAMDGIITVGEDQRVLLMNAAAEKMFGCRAEEVMGTRIERFMPNRFRATHERHVHDFGRTGVSARSMGRFGPIFGLRANGEEFPIEASISQLEVDGHKLFTVTCRDVTERVLAEADRKKLESQLQQSQKMEAFGQLAGGVAHDFNNLLTIINGYCELLLFSMESGGSRGHIEEIHKAGERASALTRQLLAFSRQQVIKPKVLEMNTVVGDIEKMLRRLIGEDIELATVMRPSAGLVCVDPGQLEQVILNLAVNARDAMPQGGRITIETDVAELDEGYANTHAEVSPGRYSLLALSDTGTGMTKEVRERIFEPFFTTKGPGHGTGLGLAVVHGIVKQNGGHVDVYSEPGRGTTVKLYLPLIVNESATQPDADLRPIPGDGEIVLLVEDEDSVREVSALALSAFGYNVLTATNGHDAIRCMEEHGGRIDLLLTDVVMPEMSGRTLAETLRERYPRLKVLFVSGYTDDAVMRHGVLQNEVAFLQKPYSLIGLSRKVWEVLRN